MTDMEADRKMENSGKPSDDDAFGEDLKIMKMAEAVKEEGNEYYRQQKYREALDVYTYAINLCPSCASYYGNRSATYIMLRKYTEGLHDARKAVQLNPSFVKGHIREGKCHLMLGNSMAASSSYARVLDLEPGNATATTELKKVKCLQDMEAKADLNFTREDYRTALYCLDRCLDHSPASLRFKVLKAEALSFLGRQQEAQELANDVLLRDEKNADALYIRGLSMYYQDSTERAFQHFQKVLRLAPDHSKARDALRRAKLLTTKKEEGNTAFRDGHLQEAYDLYTQALQIDPYNSSTNSKLYCNRANVSIRLSMVDQGIEDCTEAINLDGSYLKAYQRRAKCYMDKEEYEEAVKDYEKIYKLQKSRDNKQLLREAKVALKKSQRKDYYKILGVERTATDDEIKKAYKKRALIHHPDRHAHASKEQQKKEEIKFKEVGEAYSVLSDNRKRAQYDNNHDLEDMMCGAGGFGDVDPNQIFQAFFGMGGGIPGMAGCSFAHGGPSTPGGFPGSTFTFQFG